MKKQYEQPMMSVRSLGIVDVICASNMTGGTNGSGNNNGEGELDGESANTFSLGLN
ncbi:hypothetical protein F7D09_1075 [Bifidobacterium leontopitheci]|uniref:Uncharacterized protein n=2 Tax=Bifidobacterium leontopitheci TaxID=2650774 RepID=A0A6I1GLW3_9BIFI|nr:hypothetical protein F7D09_1075 [Bifidobacterium leontopitheci]